VNKVTKAILDPTKEIGRVSISMDNEEPLYFDRAGFRIPLVEVEVDYKPEYDFEQTNIEHWYFKYKSQGFRDVHTQFTEFRSRNQFTYTLRALFAVYFDKYIGRFF